MRERGKAVPVFFTFYVLRFTFPLSFHLQQCALTTESRPEARQPPVAARSRVRQGGLQNEENRRAAQVSVLSQHRRAPAHVVLRQSQMLPQSEQHIASA